MSILTPEQLASLVRVIPACIPKSDLLYAMTCNLIDTYEARVAELRDERDRLVDSGLRWEDLSLANQRQLARLRAERDRLLVALENDEASTGHANEVAALRAERDTLRAERDTMRKDVECSQEIRSRTIRQLQEQLRLAELARDTYRATLGRLEDERKAGR